MKKLQLDNFVLEEYDDLNIEHKSVIIELDNENSFLGSISKSFERLNEQKEKLNLNIDCAYIAYNVSYPIGFISIKTLPDKYEIRYGILPKYRKQYLASLLLQEFSYKMFDEFDIDELYLLISNNNIPSRKVAKLVGYEKVSSIRYKMHK